MPNQFIELEKLEVIDLSNNLIGGHIPTDMFSRMSNLQLLILQSNFFSGPIPAIGNNVDLEILDLSNNAFTGSIDENIFTHTSLKTIVLSVNCLSRSLPLNLCNSSSIRELYISGVAGSSRCNSNTIERSQLSIATLPDCIWSMTSLRKLYLSGNVFYGSMESFKLFDLTELGASYNLLRGTVPSFDNQVMEYFDISSNLMTGEFTPNLVPQSNTSTILAQINRFSGRLNPDSIDAFQYPEIVSGNVFSCGTLPKRDPDLDIYTCGSQLLEFSIYCWCVACAMICLVWYSLRCIGYEKIIKVFEKLKREISAAPILNSSVSKSENEYTLRFLTSLVRLQYASAGITVIIVILSLIIFSSFKLGPGSNQYSTHTHQYWYLISGVYLKGIFPATCLLLFHGLVVWLVVHAFFRVFVSDWTILRLGGSKPKEEDQALMPNDNQNFNLWASAKLWTFRVWAIGLFLSFSVLVHVGYVAARGQSSSTEIILEQVSLSIFNGIYRVLIPFFVSYLYNERNILFQQSIVSNWTMAFMLCFVDTAVPFVATLFQDDLCFHALLTGLPSENTVYSFERCSQEYADDDGCRYEDYTVISMQESFTLPFVYSYQCRNAVEVLSLILSSYCHSIIFYFRILLYYNEQTNFIPVVIISSLIESFVLPLLYFLLTSSVKDLNDELVVLGFIRFNDSRGAILSNLSYSVNKIWAAILLLLTYGIVSPFASVVVGFNVYIRLIFLRARICRYSNLQASSNNAGHNDDAVNPDEYHLEYICEKTQSSIHALLWSGLPITSAVFGFYLLDMTLDADILVHNTLLGLGLGVLLLVRSHPLSSLSLSLSHTHTHTHTHTHSLTHSLTLYIYTRREINMYSLHVYAYFICSFIVLLLFSVPNLYTRA